MHKAFDLLSIRQNSHNKLAIANMITKEEASERLNN
jgi:hypothetical protein